MFFLPFLGSLIGGAVSVILGGSLATTITVSVIAGVLVAVVNGIITNADIRSVVDEKKTKDGLNGTLKQMVNRTKNVVKLVDFNTGETKAEIRGESIADDVHNGALITV